MDSTRFLDFSNVGQFLKHLKLVYIVHRFHCGIFVHCSYHSFYFPLHSMLSSLPPTDSPLCFHVTHILVPSFSLLSVKASFSRLSYFCMDMCVSAGLHVCGHTWRWACGWQWKAEVPVVYLPWLFPASFPESSSLQSRAGCWRSRLFRMHLGSHPLLPSPCI